MACSIPLIRSAALFPMIRWLRERDGPVRQRLRAADLAYVSDDAPERPVPLLNVFSSFRIMADEEGPDIGARSVGPQSLRDLGTFGGVVSGARTPRDALHRAAAALPRYSTHELLSFRQTPGGLCVQAGWSLVLDDTLTHLTQQFSAALVTALCLATGRQGAAPRIVRIRPHPVAGLEHLRPWFGAALAPAAEAMLEVDLADEVLGAPLAGDGPKAGTGFPAGWSALKGDLSCRHSVRLLLQSMASDPPVTVDRLARSGGISARSLQRLLAAEATSVRQLSDEIRREQALEALPGSNAALVSVARDLGYSAHSSLSRAVRRWTGHSPSAFRAAAAPHPPGK
jgi:AraC-like DNA-binding protein